MKRTLFHAIRQDIQTIFDKDPAARSTLEVLTCYPGLHAIWIYRIAHRLWEVRLFYLARLLSHIGRFLTGIEIHPGARIGRRFFIDHGTGVVIGETTEIGDDVQLYQGVVLGGVSIEKKKRHPTLGNGVLIGTGAIVLGPVTVGNGARIGAASLVLKDVPECAVAMGVPARLGLGLSEADIHRLTENKLPDLIADAFKYLDGRIEEIERRLGEAAGDAKSAERHAPSVIDSFRDKEEFDTGSGI